MTIGWPQGVLLFFIFARVGIGLVCLGEKKSERIDINDRIDIFDVFLRPTALLGLLYWGGFFGGAL